MNCERDICVCETTHLSVSFLLDLIYLAELDLQIFSGVD